MNFAKYYVYAWSLVIVQRRKLIILNSCAWGGNAKHISGPCMFCMCHVYFASSNILKKYFYFVFTWISFRAEKRGTSNSWAPNTLKYINEYLLQLSFFKIVAPSTKFIQNCFYLLLILLFRLIFFLMHSSVLTVHRYLKTQFNIKTMLISP